MHHTHQGERRVQICGGKCFPAALRAPAGSCKVVQEKVEWRTLTHRGVFDELQPFSGCTGRLRTCLPPPVSAIEDPTATCPSEKLLPRPTATVRRRRGVGMGYLLETPELNNKWNLCWISNYEALLPRSLLSAAVTVASRHRHAPSCALTPLHLLSPGEKHATRISALCLTCVSHQYLVSGTLFSWTHLHTVEEWRCCFGDALSGNFMFGPKFVFVFILPLTHACVYISLQESATCQWLCCFHFASTALSRWSTKETTRMSLSTKCWLPNPMKPTPRKYSTIYWKHMIRSCGQILEVSVTFVPVSMSSPEWLQSLKAQQFDTDHRVNLQW